jgi:hypothetical protein
MDIRKINKKKNTKLRWMKSSNFGLHPPIHLKLIAWMSSHCWWSITRKNTFR